MKIKVRFQENSKNIAPTLDESKQTFNADMGEGPQTFSTGIDEGDQGFSTGMGEVMVLRNGNGGHDGKDGEDGFSPIVDLTATDAGVDITVTDADGTKTATVRNGKDGRDGVDGYTPVKGVDYFDGVDGKDGKDGINGQDGRTPVKGVDYFDGKDGVDGKPGQDGFSPVVDVQDISGGHRVTITDKDGEKQFDVMDGAGGGGGASVQSDWNENNPESPAYVQNRTHWLERPYEPILWDGSTEGRDTVDASILYGYPAGTLIAYKISDKVMTYEDYSMSHVDAVSLQYKEKTRCDIGQPFDIVSGAIWAAEYKDNIYSEADDSWNTYVSGMLASFAISGDFTSMFGITIPSTGTYVLQTDPNQFAESLNVNADTWHTLEKGYLPAIEYSDVSGAPPVFFGDGERSVKLNEQTNNAQGTNSVAMGARTTASGNVSVAEGVDTIASGTNSHAAGMVTTASGFQSFAIGNRTLASGANSFASGFETIASGENQFVCGEYNVPDERSLFIVGNGFLERSNAFYVVSNGDGVFSGTVECTGILLTNPNGTKYKITVDENGTLKVSEL